MIKSLVITFSLVLVTHLLIFWPKQLHPNDKFIDRLNLESLEVKTAHYNALYRFGRELFYSNLLSTNTKVSCSSCHVERLAESKKIDVPNFFNYHLNDNLFGGWHGKIKSIHNGNLQILGDHATIFIPSYVVHRKQLQSLLPLVTFDEMNFEYVGGYDGLPTKDEQRTIYKSIINKIINDPSASVLRRLYSEAFRQMDANQLHISQIAKALSYYIDSHFVTGKSKFDQFLDGTQDLTYAELEGARVFFSKNSCYSCHSSVRYGGVSFVDIVSINRISTSCILAPSLRNLSKTNPYYHDKRYTNLEDLLGEHYKDMKSRYIADCKTGKKLQMC